MAICNKARPEEIQFILENSKFYTAKELASILKRNSNTVSRWCRENGVVAKRPPVHNKTSTKEDIFKKLNEDTAYLAGFIAADGSIGKNNKINIVLASKDKEHIIKLANIMQFKGRIKDYTYCGFGRAEFGLISEKMASDLYKLNITQNKSKTLEPPTNLSSELVSHFIRGYFDGDGCFIISDGKAQGCVTKKLICTVLGTKKVVSWIKEEFSKHYGVMVGGIVYCKSSGGGDVWKLTLSTKSAVAFGAWIYFNSNDSNRLDRKYRRYLTVLQLRTEAAKTCKHFSRTPTSENRLNYLTEKDNSKV